MTHIMHRMLAGIQQHLSRPFLKEYCGSPGAPAWSTISFQTFSDDLDKASIYWDQELRRKGVKPTSVVGIW